MKRDRKISKFQYCDKHAGWFAGETRYRIAECFAEGGPGGSSGCEGGHCRCWPGRDFFVAELCANGAEWKLEWTTS